MAGIEQYKALLRELDAIDRAKIDRCVGMIERADELSQFLNHEEFSLAEKEADDFYAGLSDEEKIIVDKQNRERDLQG